MSIMKHFNSQPTPDDVHDLSDELREMRRTKPPAILFYPALFLAATSGWDAEMEGWYIRLLLLAANHTDLPGYLPDDDDELRALAKHESLAKMDSKLIRSILEQHFDVLIESIANKEVNSPPIAILYPPHREAIEGVLNLVEDKVRADSWKRWKIVRKKFVPSQEHPGFVYNRKLLTILRERDEKMESFRKFGREGASKRWGNKGS